MTNLPGLQHKSVLVRSPAGAALGTITFSEAPANCTFGGKDLRTLFVTARTSVYTCRTAVQGHQFARNPGSFEDFQRKFFGATNAPHSGLVENPDADQTDNYAEYLSRTHPRCADAGWQISVHAQDEAVRLVFPQLAWRGYEVERSAALFWLFIILRPHYAGFPPSPTLQLSPP